MRIFFYLVSYKTPLKIFSKITYIQREQMKLSIKIQNTFENFQQDNIYTT